ncbi:MULTISPECIES: CRISPR-associated endonuclease Cas3'' [Haloferacaceae]|uniref:CRISPR-associated endonuclease Cas3 n=1 Tax=Halorubrum glutamatedens TaxID=2707018 RepID=A0ABD5QTN7_9EURY|nr:CRISPR-associated endonuclease Cas3'' [Halobellus captivus]
MDTTPLSDYSARPGQSMERHLEGVSGLGETLIQGAETTPYGDEWVEVIEAVTWVHDIGKLTEYFQSYVETGDRTAAGEIELTYHGTFGGLVASIALMERGLSLEATAAGFYAVTKHHSVLDNFYDEVGQFHIQTDRVDGEYEVANRQLESIDETASEAADVVLQEATDGAYSWDDLVGDGIDQARRVIKYFDEIDDEEWYGCALRTWSTLVAADKMDASGLGAIDEGSLSRLEVGKLTERVRTLSTTTLPDGTPSEVYLDEPNRSLPDETASLEQRLGAIRTAANARVTEALRAGHDRGERAFELTLPTGFGKTYTGLRAALNLAEERDSRVVYALPYTSIIDQVDEQVRDVFGLSPQNPAYTKHHHLADTRSSLSTGGRNGRDGPSSGKETLHAESWRSQLVLTTFTQLFESVAGPQNVQSTKLPALQDAVILVDEPQAISMEWWGLIGRLVDHLTREYDATVVLMTATQPRLLGRLPHAPTPEPLTDLGDDAVELIADSPRVDFNLHESLTGHFDGGRPPLPLVEAADELAGATTGGTNTLAVVNTVDSAAEISASLLGERTVPLAGELLAYWRENEGEEFDPVCYLERLAEREPDPEKVVTTLTTRIRPRDRAALIAAMNAVLDPTVKTPFDATPTITVSTQLIEAGVDLSFDRLYRDYAPLPAIVQAAGRCNRRFGGDPAPATVWRLDGPEEANYVPSRLIYGDRSLLRPTRAALGELRESVGGDVIPESMMIGRGVERYYDVLHDQRRTEDRSDDLVAAFNEARGETLREASLVSSEYPTRDYLVLVDAEETTTHERYLRHRNQGEWRQARASFQTLKRTLVSIPVSDPPPDDTPEALEISTASERYDLETGRGVIDAGVQTDTEV